jgi:RecA-family ATPase
MKREISALEDLDQLAAEVNPSAPSLELPPLVTATELYHSEIVPLRPVLEDMLWDGLTMLIARPKAGKSWFTLQCAIGVAGGRVIDGVKVLEMGKVLYFALEEPKARTLSRLRQLAPEGSWTANLTFVYELRPLMGGGADQLRELIRRANPRLVVLDTFAALVKSGSKSGNDVFRSQYAEVTCLRKLAEELKTAMILVHHARKGVADSAIEAVAGTGGLAAGVDTLWQLKRRPDNEATLEIVGRETEERTLAMKFNKDPLGWEVLGDEDSQIVTAERRELLELLRDEGGLPPARIANELGKSRPAVRMLLKRMKDDGLLRKQGDKYFPSLTL